MTPTTKERKKSIEVDMANYYKMPATRHRHDQITPHTLTQGGSASNNNENYEHSVEQNVSMEDQ